MWLTAHFPYLINNFNLLFLLHLQPTIQSHSQGVLTPCKTLSTQIFDETSAVTTLYFSALWVRARKGHNINNATIAIRVRLLVVAITVMNTKLAPSFSSRYAAWNTHQWLSCIFSCPSVQFGATNVAMETVVSTVLLKLFGGALYQRELKIEKSFNSFVSDGLMASVLRHISIYPSDNIKYVLHVRGAVGSILEMDQEESDMQTCGCTVRSSPRRCTYFGG